MSLIARITAAALIVGMIAPICTAQDEHAREEEALIRGLIRDGLYEVAADRIFSFVYEYPDLPRNENMVEDIVGRLLNNNSAPAAVPLMRAYRELFPSGNQRRSMTFNLAETLFNNGEHDEATHLLEEIISDTGYRTASVLNARRMLAEIWQSQGEFASVIALVEEVAQRQRPPDLSLIYAEALLAFGEDATAEEVLYALHSRRRLDAEIKTRSSRLLGDLYLKQHRWEEIVSIFEGYSFSENVELNDDERAIALALGVGLYHLERYEEAWNAVQPIWLNKDPDDSSAQVPVVFMALNEFDAAANLLRSRFEQQTDEINIIETGELYVTALLRNGDRAAAAQTLQEMAEASSSSARRIRYLLRAADSIDDPSERIRMLKEATLWASPEPLRAEALFNLGNSYADAGDIDEAIRAWDRCADLQVHTPHPDLALLELAQIEVSRGDLDQALERIDQLMQRNPALEIQIEANALAFQIEVQRENWQKANEYFQQFQMRAPRAETPIEVWLDHIRVSLELNNPNAVAEDQEQIYLSSMPETQSPQIHPLLAAARQYLRIGDNDRGMAMLTSMESSGSEVSFASRFMLARNAFESGKWQKAYDEATKLSMERSDWLGSSAALLAADAAGENGNTSEQVRILRELGAGDPSNAATAEALARMQTIALNAGNFNGALQVDQRFSRFQPGALYAVERRIGEAARRYYNGDFQGARAIYEQVPDGVHLQTLHRLYFAMALYKTNAVERAAQIATDINERELPVRLRWECDRIRAAGFVLKNRFTEALDILQKLLEQPLPDSMRFDCILEGARVASSAGDWTKADELYRSYIADAQARDVDSLVLEGIAEDYIKHENWGMAIEIFRRMQLRSESTEETVRIGFRIAGLLADKDGADASAEAYLNIAYRYPEFGAWPAKARIKAAEQFEVAGRAEIAMRQYRLVAESYAGTEEAQKAAARLRALEQKQNRIQEEQLRPPGN